MNAFSLIVLMMLLMSIFALAPNVQQVRALGTIYIRADGSVEGTTDIQTTDSVTYAFVADINGSIVIERNNIVIDGNGHTLQGTNSYNSEGIDLSGTANVKIKNITIKDFNYGIMLDSSLNVTVSGNNLTNNYGIYLHSSSDNTISENSMTNGGAGVCLSASSNNMISGNHVEHNSGVGIWLRFSTNNTISDNNVTNGGLSSVGLSNSSNNVIYHNNFVDCTQRVYEDAGAINTWDDGYPSGGNFWSDYESYGSSSDFSRFDSCSGPFQNVSGSDGIIDAPYSISSQNLDRYPLAFQYNQLNPPRASFNLSSSIQPFDGYSSGFSQSLVEAGLPITFDASLSHGTWNGTSQEPIVEYNWDFGDGNLTSTMDSTIVHVYEIYDVYEIYGRLNVTLGIVDAEGSTSSSWDMIMVFMPTSISVSIKAPSSVLGFSVDIYGRLNDIHGVGLSDELVVLYYTLPGIQNWYPISSTMTDDNGNYSVLWIPSATGCFFLKAEWSGNMTHMASNGTVTLSVIYQNTYAFSVESNSTISGLAFNVTTKALSFSVSGETGTTGYAKITIAKTLVSNINDLEVTIDGVEYSYSAVSLDDSWLLTFTYNHSIHQVDVYLDKSGVPGFPTLLAILLFMATFLLLTCAAARWKISKRRHLHDQGSTDNA